MLSFGYCTTIAYDDEEQVAAVEDRNPQRGHDVRDEHRDSEPTDELHVRIREREPRALAAELLDADGKPSTWFTPGQLPGHKMTKIIKMLGNYKVGRMKS